MSGQDITEAAQRLQHHADFNLIVAAYRDALTHAWVNAAEAHDTRTVEDVPHHLRAMRAFIDYVTSTATHRQVSQRIAARSPRDINP